MDIAKLKKQATKAADAAASAHTDMQDSIERWGKAVAALAIANEAVEQEEALEAARELRGKKSIDG